MAVEFFFLEKKNQRGFDGTKTEQKNKHSNAPPAPGVEEGEADLPGAVFEGRGEDLGFRSPRRRRRRATRAGVLVLHFFFFVFSFFDVEREGKRE